MVSVTRHEEFEAAHRLRDYDGACTNLHGHSYKIEVTVTGEQNDKQWGMIVDFNYLKKAIKSVVPDHMFIACSKDPISLEIANILSKNNLKYIIFDFDPTAENMCKYFAEEIASYLRAENINNIIVSKVKLWETTNSYAEYSL